MDQVKLLIVIEEGLDKKDSIAESIHASMQFFANKYFEQQEHRVIGIDKKGSYFNKKVLVPEPLSDEEKNWIEHYSMEVKFVSKDKLNDIIILANQNQLQIRMSRNNTCLAIGPHWYSKMEKINVI
jgi:hypothetical protein